MALKISPFFNATGAPKALVAPLDWGLGHATRCVPIIKGLLEDGWQVWLAGEPPVQSLLQAEFPNLSWLPLKGYRVRYGATGAHTVVALCRQMRRLWRAIQEERHWLQQQMAAHHFDLVVSDNRYGLYHPEARCIFLGHQLQIQTPFRVGTGFLRRLQYRFVSHFDAWWVPDFPGAVSLAGRLSHPWQRPDIPLRYTGPLSRFLQKRQVQQPFVLLLVSGPEPQRSLLEAALLQQAAAIPRSFVLVRGLPGPNLLPTEAPNIHVYNHLPSEKLNALMAAASLVVCRSGYSSIMDLAALGKKSILVPTPAQTEQQYLARHLQEQGFAMWRPQRGFNLAKALQEAECFIYQPWPQAPAHLLEGVLNLDCGLAIKSKAFTEKKKYIESAQQ